MAKVQSFAAQCRSPYGERGLKLRETLMDNINHRRSPYGERGLK